MGYNTAILVLNDAIEELNRDPQRVYHSLLKGISTGDTSFGNGLQILPSRHADHGQLIFVGGNLITLLRTHGSLDEDGAAIAFLNSRGYIVTDQDGKICGKGTR